MKKQSTLRVKSEHEKNNHDRSDMCNYYCCCRTSLL